jgi:hypothetical protein
MSMVSDRLAIRQDYLNHYRKTKCTLGINRCEAAIRRIKANEADWRSRVYGVNHG